jgi:hypothetical protein
VEIKMRTYILTNKEREMVEVFLENPRHLKLEGFKVLLHRIRKMDMDRVEDDLKLIERLLKTI